MGQRHSYIKKVNFEDIKQIIRNPNKFILINTLKADNQECLISNTIDIKKEEAMINNCLKYKKNVFHNFLSLKKQKVTIRYLYSNSQNGHFLFILLVYSDYLQK